jgi:RNA polymerase sigma-70 factor (ECF subfamily)
LFRVAAGILKDRHAAEDVCQQAFLKACQQVTGGSAPDHLKAWLTRVVVNESLCLLRRRKVQERTLAQTALSRGVQGPAAPGGTHRDPSPPDTTVHEALLAGLDTLPDATRAVLVLRVMHGLSGNEVKEMLGCSAAEVSRRLYHGMEQLRRQLTADAATTLEVGGHEC